MLFEAFHDPKLATNMPNRYFQFNYKLHSIPTVTHYTSFFLFELLKSGDIITNTTQIAQGQEQEKNGSMVFQRVCFL